MNWQALLYFIYKDTLIEDGECSASSSSCVPFVSDTLEAKLLAAAVKYVLPRLRLMCESVLCKVISVNSVAYMLALADRHCAMDLKSVCLKFAAENLVGMSFQIFSFSSFLFLFYCRLGFTQHFGLCWNVVCRIRYYYLHPLTNRSLFIPHFCMAYAYKVQYGIVSIFE